MPEFRAEGTAHSGRRFPWSKRCFDYRAERFSANPPPMAFCSRSFICSCKLRKAETIDSCSSTYCTYSSFFLLRSVLLEWNDVGGGGGRWQRLVDCYHLIQSESDYPAWLACRLAILSVFLRAAIFPSCASSCRPSLPTVLLPPLPTETMRARFDIFQRRAATFLFRRNPSFRKGAHREAPDEPDKPRLVEPRRQTDRQSDAETKTHSLSL